jgi:hypothetical protein
MTDEDAPIDRAADTKRQFAARFSVSKRTVSTWLSRGLPFLKLSERAIRVPVAEGTAWVKSNFLTHRHRTQSGEEKDNVWRKLLVLTFKPAVQSAWEEDLKCHVDFKGWQFIKPGGLTYEQADKKKPLVCFGSFQDYLGRNPSTGGIKTKNEWVHATNWDCVILDEYHYGAWRANAKELFEAEDEKELDFAESREMREFDEDIMPITTGGFLYLSGTPFRAIATGEFIEEQIFNWTYSDEQRAKQDWKGENNPYAALPRMVLLTYRLPDAIRELALQGEFNEFDLNVFFSATGIADKAKFTYEDEVQKWLDLIRGAFHGHERGQSETRRAKTADAVFGRAAVEFAVAHVLVPAQRGLLPRHAEPAREKAERVLSGLSRHRGRWQCRPASARMHCRRCWKSWTAP